jgi:hypothetical protein
MHDPDIRNALINQLVNSQGSQYKTIIEEMGILSGDARIDIAVVTDTLQGYEIKSDYDTLYRLDDQRLSYNKIFEKITIVATTKHIESILNKVDDHWGVVEAAPYKTKEGIRLRTIRRARSNPDWIATNVAFLLWKDELLEEVKKNNLGVVGLHKKTRSQLSEILADSMNNTELQNTVCKKLSTRTEWREKTSL